jgi:hypothetical protein
MPLRYSTEVDNMDADDEIAKRFSGQIKVKGKSKKRKIDSGWQKTD